MLIRGELISKRIMGKVGFAEIRRGVFDISTIYVRHVNLGENAFESFRKISEGSAVEVECDEFTNSKGETIYNAERITVFAEPAPAPDPTLLTHIATCELVAELKKREGVETQTAGYLSSLSIVVPGPAIVLTVID